MKQNQVVLTSVLNRLMSRYKQRVPDVAAIVTAMTDENIINTADEIENDHIAFRSMGVPHLGIQTPEKIFLRFGYEKRDFYFSRKKN